MSDSKDAFCSHVNVSLDLWTPSLGTVGGGGTSNTTYMELD